jgi:hypothetical protein
MRKIYRFFKEWGLNNIKKKKTFGISSNILGIPNEEAIRALSYI